MSNLDFEKPILELEGKISELQNMSQKDEATINISEEITRLRTKADRLLQQAYSKLTPVQKVQVARHAERPRALDYIEHLISDFSLLAGDRNFAEDHAIITGIGRFQGQSVAILGNEKGHDTESRIKHNFGMARPEGYRKAQRIMKLADQFKIPVITFVDTSGAYPGVGAEERGQAQAIAESIETCLSLDVPIISVIIGEGGSGGAIAIATADKVIMLEHAIYSVISPEGCASILWKSAEFTRDAAEALRLTAQDLYALKIIDEIVKEPLGGAHRNKAQTMDNVKDSLILNFEKLKKDGLDDIKQKRRKKYLAIGR